MKKIKLLSLLLIFSILFANKNSISKPVFVVSINPLQYILSEITGDKAEIIRLVPPGASPHTYRLKPSQVYKSKKSKALFYVSNNLDAWVKSIPSNNKIELIKLLPKNNLLFFDKKKGIVDPHFWTDPLTIKSFLPKLVNILIGLNPQNKEYYLKKSNQFSKKLSKLDKKISSMLKEFNGSNIFLFHPSFKYFLKRYNLNYSGSIEELPGKEPTPRYIQKIVNKIKKYKIKAIFTEPQLPVKPAKIIAESCNLKIYYLDPLGNKNIKNYENLILYNAKIFRKALKK